MNALSALSLVAALALAAAASAHAKETRAPPPAPGVNLAGGEFGDLPGKSEHDYHYPSDQELAWARSRGFVVVRAPFRWERLQPALGGELDADELALLESMTERARAHGLAVILDPHNYGRWRGDPVGSSAVPATAFADFWRRLAARFAGRKDVIFGLMNEPHDMPVAQWAGAAQAAIDAVRATGACNLVLVPGANWTGAHSWRKVDETGSNDTAMAGVRDRGPHAFEFHQYLDSNWSGAHAECRQPEEVVAGLSVATEWLRAHKQKGFLGEFGSGPDAQCLAGLDAMLKHIDENRDVWLGWTYWAAGAWWPSDYPLSIQPAAGAERPQMATLAKWIGKAQAPEGCGAPPAKTR